MTHSHKLKHGVSLLESLAELEHKQWESWTKYTVETILKSSKSYDAEVMARNFGKLHRKWFDNWKPYSKLSEKDKEKDRIWARKVLRLLLPHPEGRGIRKD